MHCVYIEHLSEIAPQAYELSGRLCGACRNLHGLWPYIRLSRSSTGLEDKGSNLEQALRNSIGDERRKVLIAGAADTGLLSLVVRAGNDFGIDVTVLDICESPLELCRRLASKWSMPIETLRQDLVDLKARQAFDLVLVHGTLHFIAANKRLDVLTRIRHALRPNGRLVLLFNTSRLSTIGSDNQFHVEYAKSVVSELKRLQIPLPDAEEAIIRRLLAHSRQRQLREGAFAHIADVDRLLEAAGFKVVSCSQVDIASPAQNFVSHISKQRFMTFAEPKPAT